ncbi:hypothetical protein MACK_003815 [Theileria orientalis]|uniref:Uncharacterized protein n=1 Tax=Theileria orientalis TaxID=68886 RepID=A0A976SIV9_THEOR|nr:hypothetical protein MACK_003815 [Theileria orientalis]
MSLNPVLCQDIHNKVLLPLCTTGEAYVLSRPKTKVTLELSTRKLVGFGDTIMTTHRIVFIKNQDKDFKKGFSSIDVPFSHLENPRFEQPLFGTNHMKFILKSDRNGAHPLESEGELKIFFVTGGADLFLKLFFSFYAKFRNNPNLMSSANPMTEMEGDFCAFVDPSDTSHVYYTQPQTSGPEVSNQEPDRPETEGRKKFKLSPKAALQTGKGFAFLRFLR